MRWGKWIAALALLMLSGVLVSCGSDTPAADTGSAGSNQTTAALEAPGAQKTLSFRITWKSYSGRGEAIQAIVDQYNAQAEYGITLRDGDEDRAAVEALLQENTDTVYVLPYRLIRYFGDLGYLADLSQAFADAEDLFYNTVWELAGMNGKTYGIPWLGHSMCLLYNQSLLEHAGVDAGDIEDMDSFLRAIETIEDQTGAKGLGLVGAESNDISWMVNQFVYGYGSDLVSDDGKTVVINNDAAAKALWVYRDWLGPHAQLTWQSDTAGDVVNAFRKQEIAFEILGIWGVTDIMRNGSPFEVGILPLSAIGLKSEVGPMMLAVPAGISEQGKTGAFDFIRYMISKTAQEEIMKGEYSPEHDTYYPFRTPIRSDMADSHIFIAHPEYQIFVEGFNTPSIDVPVPAWQLVKDEVYAPGLHRVMNYEITIAEFLQEVEDKGNQILQEQ